MKKLIRPTKEEGEEDGNEYFCKFLSPPRNNKKLTTTTARVTTRIIMLNITMTAVATTITSLGNRSNIGIGDCEFL